ncbi:MAG TPA: hypothetical protein DER01_15650 [Phycisphaerales bacterium]|nr:hypothetical protein [Phycisphaerales bacterium]
MTLRTVWRNRMNTQAIKRAIHPPALRVILMLQPKRPWQYKLIFQARFVRIGVLFHPIFLLFQKEVQQ